MLEVAINAVTLVKSTSYVSDGISLGGWCSGFSMYYEITGDGTVDFFHYVSLDGTNFVKEDRAIKRGLTKTSGPGGDGKGVLHIPVMPCDAFKIEAEEVGGVNTATVTVKALCREGRFGDFPAYDGTTNATRVMEYEHHEIHSGSHYIVAGHADLTNGQVLDFTWQMPDTTKWIHWTWEIATESETLWHIYETAVATNALANTITPLNSDRNSDNTSGTTMKFEVHADLAAANADTNVSSSTELESGVSGAGKDAGHKRRGHELILKQGELYALRAVASAAGNISFIMHWYEHTNR